MSLAFEAKSAGTLGLQALSLSALLTTLIVHLHNKSIFIWNIFFQKKYMYDDMVQLQLTQTKDLYFLNHHLFGSLNDLFF